jgi:hypothetical protein
MEHRDHVRGIVVDVLHRWNGRPASFVEAWTEVRRELRALRDTSSTLREDERTALEVLRGFQAAS